MMKKCFPILLSFILLASHMYLTIGTHFCGGEVVESKILIGKTHMGCKMPDMIEPYADSEKTSNNGVSFDKLPCCDNEYQTIQVTDEFVKDVASQSFNDDFASEFIYTTLNYDLFPKTKHHSYTVYTSPPIEKDVQVFFQTFLI